MTNPKLRVIFIIGFLLLFSPPSSLFAGLLTGKRFCIDPGHGGTKADVPQGVNYNLGAGGYNGSAWPDEKDLVLDCSKCLWLLLKETDATEVRLTRIEDVYTSYHRRVTVANGTPTGTPAVDMFISVHHNGVSNTESNYTQTNYDPSPGTCSTNGTKNHELAVYTVNELDSLLRIGKYKSNDGTLARKWGKNGVYVLHHITMVGELTEASFISCRTE
ncbi:MAG: N-acetylmuramoyl-L-alanine amidase [bacterium]